MSKGLEVWDAVKKYLNLYHHQVVGENIDVKTVEGMSLDIIEKSLKALEIIKDKEVDADLFYTVIKDKNQKDKLWAYNFWLNDEHKLTKKEFDLLKEVLL